MKFFLLSLLISSMSWASEFNGKWKGVGLGHPVAEYEIELEIFVREGRVAGFRKLSYTISTKPVPVTGYVDNQSGKLILVGEDYRRMVFSYSDLTQTLKGGHFNLNDQLSTIELKRY